MNFKSILLILMVASVATAGAGPVQYSYDEAGRLVKVAYPDGNAISYTYDKAGNLLSREVESTAAPAIKAVVNAASFAAGGIVPGEIATIFGTNLTSATGINLTSGLPLPTSFLKVSVLVNGSAAPLFAVDNVNGQQQINFQVPWEVAGQAAAMVAVAGDGIAGPSVAVPILVAQPGIISYNTGGNTFGVILHANFKLADAGHPAAAGETVLIFCTGLGAVTPTPSDGTEASGQPTVAAPSVTIGGANAAVSFSGLAPGFVGLNQVNVQVPPGLKPGNQPVVLTIRAAASNSVLLPVQ